MFLWFEILEPCIVCFVQVILTLEEPEIGVTVVRLTHSDIPEEDR